MRTSVIIAAYNAEKWVGRAIDSILRQEQPVSEIVIVDDGSTDGTAEVLRGYGSAVRVFHQENAGLSVARNRALAEATGEWIAFLDSDDEWLPHFTAAHKRMLDEHPGLRWSCCNVEDVTDGVGSPRPLRKDVAEWARREVAVPFFEGALKGLTFGTCGFLIHESVFQTVGTFDAEMRSGMDIDLWSRIGMKYPLVGYCPDLCWRYHHDNSASLSSSKRWRDRQLESHCRNLQLARSLGPEVAEQFYPYARWRAMSYLFRAAGRSVQINPNIVAEARRLFSPDWREWAVMGLLRCLPARLAERVIRRVKLDLG